jgi:hypothetical protein
VEKRGEKRTHHVALPSLKNILRLLAIRDEANGRNANLLPLLRRERLADLVGVRNLVAGSDGDLLALVVTTRGDVD